MSEKREYKINYGGKEVIIETGRLAKQADGSVLVSSYGTQVLVTVCSSEEIAQGQDFFPLTVDYREKFFAAGKFLGGFMKRETRPTTQETLNGRLIDRPLRPLFPNGYFFETFIQATVLSYDPKADPEVLAGIGASAALVVSNIPFLGPISMCKVGRIDGNFVLNPAYSEWINSDMEIAVAASKDAILMVEGESKEISEEDMLEALMFAHDNIRPLCELQEKMQKEVGRTKRVFESVSMDEGLMKKVEARYAADVKACMSINPKMERQVAVANLIKKAKSDFEQSYTDFGLSENCSFKDESYKAIDQLLYKMMRKDILDNNKRIAGRALDEVRPIKTEVGVLKMPHGSSLFTRGETQVLATVTIGSSDGDQMSDRIVGMSHDKFYLHYSFPPFSVGEARGSRGVGRRELGHGNLAERAIKAVIPSHDEFSYTLRVCCEVLESNGSSSMGSVCSGSMALMDAGVPLKAPVAGVAMGLISDGNKFKILTDILGDEDHLGDMDFKVAGTEKGITAIQMDIKITGITKEIIKDALKQAHKGRLHILGEMAKTISSGRKDFRDNVPKIISTKIAPDKIGALIGPGGKNIRKIQETYSVSLECVEDGTIRVCGIDKDKINQCIADINLQINGPVVGSDYEGVVVTVKEYGAFVDIASGCSGLLHVSEMSDQRVDDVRDFVEEGDRITVKVVDIDRMGRIKLSAKDSTPLVKKHR